MKLQKITLLLFTFFTIITFSQTDKGSLFIGGTTNFGSSYQTEGDKGFTTTTSNFTFSSNVGYAIMEDLFVGLNVQFLSSDYEIKFSNSESNTKQIIFSPFMKYYFLKDKFRPFALVRYGFGKSKYNNNDSNDEYESESDLTKLNLGGGISYFFTDYFSLEFEAFYQKDTSSSTTLNDDLKYYGFGTNLGFSIFF